MGLLLVSKSVLLSRIKYLKVTKGTNLEKSAKFNDRKTYAVCASGAALYSMRTLRAR